MYGRARRRPTASVNLITVHDGFTMRDLVSYDAKHNEANGQANRDGTDDNRSWNCGAEGTTSDAGVLALRARQSRAMLSTLLLSFGIPMVLGGDEMGRTQQGNNNAYCQDNATTWIDWSNTDGGLLEFTKRLIALRRTHPVFRRARFLAGAEAHELRWFTPAGSEMTVDDWNDQSALSVALYLDGSDDPDRAADGTWLIDDDFMVLVNAWWEPLDFTLPATRPAARWQVEVDTYDLDGSGGASNGGGRGAGEHVTVNPRSVVVLKSPRPDTAQALRTLSDGAR
jgi:glycogen operon protein